MNPTDGDSTRPLRRRLEKDSRYYEAHVCQDLWGDWVITRIWGRRGSKLGQVRRAPCESYAEALDQLATVAKQRERRGYAPAGAIRNDGDPRPMTRNPTTSEAASMSEFRKYKCLECEHIYDEAKGDPDSGIPPRTGTVPSAVPPRASSG
jgi:predicted DNA-binding WGR domain protein